MRTVFPADDWRSGNRAFTGEPFRRNLTAVDQAGIDSIMVNARPTGGPTPEAMP
ncbi:MAG: hypothetical protein WAV54_15905 [Acidimicrobiales bacterium]